MEAALLLPLGAGVELTRMEVHSDQLLFHVTTTSSSSPCPVCAKPATRVHSHYQRVVKDLPCAGQPVQLRLYVRKFFCATVDCPRKIFAERLPHLVAPWAQMTSRLCQALQAIGLATCGRLGARLASRLGIATAWMTILRRVMDLPEEQAADVSCLGLDDFSCRRGRPFGTVLVDLEQHQVLDRLPDRQAAPASAWMKRHPEITSVSRDRSSEYASAAAAGAPQAIQVADRFPVVQHLSEAVQHLLARVILEMKAGSLGTAAEAQAQGDTLLPMEAWRPAQEEGLKQILAARRAERQAR